MTMMTIGQKVKKFFKRLFRLIITSVLLAVAAAIISQVVFGSVPKVILLGQLVLALFLVTLVAWGWGREKGPAQAFGLFVTILTFLFGFFFLISLVATSRDDYTKKAEVPQTFQIGKTGPGFEV